MIAKDISYDARSASNIAGYVLVGGATLTALYAPLGLRCPMQSVGLACPGCGCGRASIALFREGPLEAFRLQPTALLFLFSITVLAVGGRWAWTTRQKWISNIVVALPILLGCVNLVFQLIRAGSINK